ncbi:MAG: protease inhibitor I42 family protein [Intrasporangium sp.]|uniref:protease inhibitor I42 family protein n=1 Tax=Intrasporangium sp. TaxID=1925024 RepID=UPI003F8166C2
MQHVIAEPQDESRVELAMGDEVVLRLGQPSGGGYLWTLSEVPGFLTVLATEVERVDVALPRQGRTATLGLRATGPGSGDVVVRLRRPWEAEAADQRRIHVEVR